MQYKNPVLGGYFPDPSVCRVGGDFYLVNSTFEFFPAVPIFHSKNLVNWTQIGYCVTEESYLDLKNCRNSGGIYAPTIRYNNGVFYMTTTDVSGLRNFFVTATNPAGPWSKPILMDFPGIDPSFYFEGDKAYYMSNEPIGNGVANILIAEIDIKTGKRLTDFVKIWNGSGGIFPEGPHVYKKDDYYYLLLAEGGTDRGHMVTMARSKNIFGPYEGCERNPILSHRNCSTSNIQGTGHMDLFEDQKGNWWAIFLGYRLSQKYFHHLGRETFLAPVTWEKDGFPLVNGGNAITEIMATDLLPAEISTQDNSFVDKFDSDKIDLRWEFLRAPSLVPYSVGNGLTLKSNGTNISTMGTPSFIGARQTDFDCEVYCTIKADCKDDFSVGLSAFYNNERHFDICIMQGKVMLKKRFDDMQTELSFDVDTSKEIVLCVTANKTRYGFGFGSTKAEAKANIIGGGETRHLASEAAIMSFTGAFIAIFAEGSTQGSAHISEYEYKAFDEEL